MIDIGTVLENRYLIEQQIGKGGMGAVYLATDQRFASRVAIKETLFHDAVLTDAFEREARLLNSLHHPVLPHVSDYFSTGDKHFIVMEYIEGAELSETLKQSGKFRAADVLRWASQLLDALDYLHSQDPPIIHRDIKPQNLKITPRGDIILLDFGLAKLESADRTDEVSIFGYSRTYSPLEQIEGTGTDQRSDIFSLGASGYHLLTGVPPLDALKRAAAIIAGKPDPLPRADEINPEIPAAVASVLQTALALNPDARFNSARAMRRAIEHAVGDEASAQKEQDSPSSPIVVAAADNDSTADELSVTSFPALAAFAADAVNNPAAQTNNQPANETAVQTAAASDSDGLAAARAVHLPEEATRVTPVAPSANRNWLAASAALVILLFGGLLVWSINRQTDAPVESNLAPAAQAAPLESASPAAAAAPEDSAPEDSAPVVSPEIIAARPSPRSETVSAEAPKTEKSASVTATTSDSDRKDQTSSRPPAARVRSGETEPDARPASPPKKPAVTEAVTRPRISPNRAPARRESSVSEIEQFIFNQPISREERQRRRLERQEQRRRQRDARRNRAPDNLDF